MGNVRKKQIHTQKKRGKREVRGDEVNEEILKATRIEKYRTKGSGEIHIRQH